MKFTCTVDINAPLEKVAAIYGDISQRTNWQKNTLSYEVLRGEPGEVGAKSLIRFDSPQGPQELYETITVSNLPHEQSGFYVHTHTENTMTNRFTALGPNQTRYETEVHYTALIGIFVKIIAFLVPGKFKQQVQLQMQWLKEYVEETYDSSNVR